MLINLASAGQINYKFLRMKYPNAGYTLTDLVNRPDEPVIPPEFLEQKHFDPNKKYNIGGEDYRIVPAINPKGAGISDEDAECILSEFQGEHVLLPFCEPRGADHPIIYDCIYFMSISNMRFFRCLRFFADGQYISQQMDRMKPGQDAEMEKEWVKQWLWEYFSKIVEAGEKTQLDKNYPASFELWQLIDIIAQEIYVGFNGNLQEMFQDSPPRAMQRHYQAQLSKIASLQVQTYASEVERGATLNEQNTTILRHHSLIYAKLAISTLERILMNHEILENKAEPEIYKSRYLRSVNNGAFNLRRARHAMETCRPTVRQDMRLDHGDVFRILDELLTEISKGAALTVFNGKPNEEGSYFDVFAAAEKQDVSLREYQYKKVHFQVCGNRYGKVGYCNGMIHVSEKAVIAVMKHLSQMGMDFDITPETRLIQYPCPPEFENDIAGYHKHVKNLNLQQTVSEVFTRAIRVITISEGFKEYRHILNLYKIAKTEMYEKFARVKGDPDKGVKPHTGFQFVQRYFRILDELMENVRFGTKSKRDILKTVVNHHKDLRREFHVSSRLRPSTADSAKADSERNSPGSGRQLAPAAR